MGAAIAIREAAGDARIRALVLESPMVSLDDAMAAWFRKRRAPFPRTLARLVTGRASQIAGVSLTRPRPIDLAARVRCPVLVIHGSEDSLVAGCEARRLAEASPRVAEFVEVPGAGHSDVIALGGQSLLREIVRFLTANVP
jgi:pimeloyl-ACP methyl ester carboxylesterase